ncbi:MAG: mechanosensitive ion channel [Acidimicrobiia bacterium]|nr:mechanosensitive ion channel [Acidimicrobiia bacterium]
MQCTLSSRRAMCVVVMAMLGLLLTVASLGQDTPPAPPPERPLSEQIPERQAEIDAELAQVRAQIEATEEQPPETLVREETLLERVGLLLQQQLALLTERSEAEASLAQLKRDLDQLQTTGPSETPPYSMLLLDTVRDELRTLRGRVETVEAGVNAAADAREQARSALEQRETSRRRARESLETNDDETRSTTLARQLRLAELESRVAAEELQLRQIEHQRQLLLRETFETRVALATERESRFALGAIFAPDDLRAKTVELEAKEDQLRQQLELQQSRIEFWEREWLEAKGRLEASATDDSALIDEVLARRMAFQAQQREATILGRRLERLAAMREMWRRRFQIWRGSEDRATVSTWDADARTVLESLDTEYRLQELELRDLASERVTLQSRLDELGTDGGAAAHWVRQQIQRNTSLADVYEANAVSIESARRLAERVLDDIGGRLGTVSWSERLGAAWDSAVAVWNFEITSVDDRSITVGKIAVGLVLLIVGFYLSKLISTLMGRRLLPKLGLDEGAAAAIRSIIFYLLLIGFVVFALRTVNIPLTAFTILGGAIAIGIGFGSQAIMNNFMSGLILIAERPVRVGDLIQLGDLYGSVQHIGARSTRVLTGNNIEIVVPNSSFLENNVINWTLSESKVRIHVTVGVVYGSPTREVTRLLKKAVEEHGRVLKSPAPIVLFTEFGDNSLNFEIHFWIMMRRIMDRKMIESDIRYRIDNLFHEAKIVIAFPQRDVHIDAPRPLDIRVLADEAVSTAGE